VLQFAIAWNEEAADVDLSVTDPSGSTVNKRQRSSPLGLRLDRDCPGTTASAESCGGQNTENVFLEGLEPKRGHYKVEVRLIDPHEAKPPIRGRVRIRRRSNSICNPGSRGFLGRDGLGMTREGRGRPGRD
jgi:hypothetical protein